MRDGIINIRLFLHCAVIPVALRLFQITLQLCLFCRLFDQRLPLLEFFLPCGGCRKLLRRFDLRRRRIIAGFCRIILRLQRRRVLAAHLCSRDLPGKVAHFLLRSRGLFAKRRPVYSRRSRLSGALLRSRCNRSGRCRRVGCTACAATVFLHSGG